MGQTFKSILKGLTNGVNGTPETPPASNKPRGWAVASITDDQRKAYRALAHKALREGLTVFMSKDTVAGFSRLLKTDATAQNMRRLLEEIGNGTLVLTAPTTQARPAARHTKPVIPMVLSVDQLSAGMPLSLKQAARILNVTPNKLYFRCVTGRIHFERDKSRYFIPAQEVARLQVIGL